MVIKVLIRRKIREGKTREVFAMLNKIRSDAINQKGYISGETLFNYENPQEILVITVWQSIDNWLKWRDNPERQANERRFENWLEEPPEYITYVLGTYYTQFSK